MGSTFSPEEMRRYWRAHARHWKNLDRERDPEGLTNVCYNGAPLWLNRFAAQLQRRTFLRLLADVGPVEGRRVLDIGCGTGRWSRLLAGLGARVIGIDLQSETLRDNAARLPACRFTEMSADALGFTSGSFDLVVAVTVLQHLPYETQDAALSEVRRVLVSGGRALLLEATHDRGPDVFSHAVKGWIDKAAAAGLREERTLPYDYAPLVHLLRGLAGRLGAARRAGQDLPPVEEFVARFRTASGRAGAARTLYRLSLRAATAASYPLEPIFEGLSGKRGAHHAGLLLRAV